jgi:hypothetical protein
LRAAPLYVLSLGSGIGELGTVPSLSVISSALAATKHFWWVLFRDINSMPVPAASFVTVLNCRWQMFR